MKRAFLIAVVLVAGSIGACTSVLDLQPGQCFDDGAEGEQLSQVQLIDCNQPLLREVYSVFDYPAGGDAAYPGEQPLEDLAEERCSADFATYVGIPYEESRFFVLFLTPSPETWSQGDREIVCTLHGEENERLTGSKRNSRE